MTEWPHDYLEFDDDNHEYMNFKSASPRRDMDTEQEIVTVHVPVQPWKLSVMVRIDASPGSGLLRLRGAARCPHHDGLQADFIAPSHRGTRRLLP
jgi:hypothetical protein